MNAQLLAFITITFALTSWAQSVPFNFRKTIAEIDAKFEKAREYSFEGDLSLIGKRGEQPARLLTKAKVKLAVAPGGKRFLRLEPADKDEYVLVSDGQKSWAYVPKLKQYTEQEEAAIDTDEDDETASSDERDIAESFARQVAVILGRLGKTAFGADLNGTAEVKFEGRKQVWPIVRVMSKKDEQEGQSLTELVVDPDSLRIGRMIWSNVTYEKKEKTTLRLEVNFSSFQVGSLPESTFVFTPPNKTKLVESVPIPGQTGSFLLNHAAPDFELKTLEGEKIHLADLKQPVLLSFWASWCGPCRRELPSIDRLNREFGGKGILILGVNDEGKGTAQRFLTKEGLSLTTLDDSSLKLHRLYRVRSIPSVFLIDAQGKVVKFFKGAHDEKDLRAALKTVGL